MRDLLSRVALGSPGRWKVYIVDEVHQLTPDAASALLKTLEEPPRHVVFVGLSATVSNADELRRWIERVHGPMALVWHDERAVPLEHYFFLDGKLHLVQNAEGHRVERFPEIGGEAKLARLRNRQRRFTFGDEDDEPPARITLARGIQAERAKNAEPLVPEAREKQRPESRDCGEVDLGVVDAVEDVGEDSGCEGHDEELIAEIVGNVPDGQSSAADIRILSRGG